MRALAEFIMRGRAQAAIVAVLGSLVPLFSAGALALVTLRRGGVDGSHLMAWAMLLPVVMALAGPETLPMAFYTLCVLAAVMGGALVLRKENNWAQGLLGLIALSAAGGLIYGWTFPEFNAALAADAEARAQAFEQAQGQATQRTPITESLVVGLVSSLIALQALLALVLGRWWQAMLYNPGGFRAEFQELRLGKNTALLLFGVAALCITRPNAMFWGLLAGLPLVVVTAAVVHNRVRTRGMGAGWLVLFYLLMLFQPLYLIAACVGLSDCWVNYRRRSGSGAEEDKPDE